MTLLYCATCSSPRLKQSPTRILPLKTPLPVLYFILNLTLTLTLKLPHLLSHFSALVTLNFVVLPRWALWDHPQPKTNNSANADFQPTPNTQEDPSTTVKNLTSRICKLEKLFPDGIATYTSFTKGIHSQYFFLYDEIRQLEPGNSDVFYLENSLGEVRIRICKSNPTNI